MNQEHRVNLGQAAPELYRAVVALDAQVKARASAAGLQMGFIHLMLLRASQLNGCAFCVRMHTADAMGAGEGIERISVLPAWRETRYFDPKERAALALVEAITHIGEGQVPDEVYAAATGALDEAQIAAVEWIAVIINVWNRVAIASRTPVAPRT